ncbi:MAG: tetratricopeptide repeat protein [Candidatus Riflebacteria bacterium]|nr:tetratricopeptide repeat protein [Candidatus Riflebacteria bacterium]
MAIDRNQTYAQRFFDAAIEMFEKGQFNKAIENIKKAIEKAPGDADFVAAKGILFHKMKELNFAMNSYQEAIRISPNHSQSHFNLGLIMMKIGNIGEAIAEWETVLKNNPKDFEALFNIAIAKTQQQNYGEAVSLLEKVLTINPDHIPTHHNLGVIYRDHKKFDKAKYHLEKLKFYDSTFLEIVNNEITKIQREEFLDKLIKQSNIEEILNSLPRSKKQSLNDKIADALIALLRGDFSKSLKLSDEILEAIPKDFQTRLIRAQSLQGGARIDDAIMEFQSLIEEKPNSTDAHFQIANAYLEKGDLDKALEHFEIVRSFDRHFPLINENIEAINGQKMNG